MINLISNNKKSDISFGTNLVVGQGVTEHLNKHPEELKKIQDFKNYLATDGKNWNAELTYDTFTPSSPDQNSNNAEILIRRHAKEFDWRAREQAEALVSKMEPQEAVNLIEKLTKDPDDRVREDAVSMTAYIKDPKIAASMIEKFAMSDDSQIAIEAAGQAGGIKDSTFAINLIEKLSQNPNPQIRYAALNSAGSIKDSSTRDLTIEKFANSEDVHSRRAAAANLAKVESKELFGKLLEKIIF